MEGSSGKFWGRGSGTIRNWRPTSKPFSTASSRRRGPQPSTPNLALKVTAVALAFLLWTLVKQDSRQTVRDVPIVVANRDPGWVNVREPDPATADVTFSGPIRQLLRLGPNRVSIVVPVDEVADSVGLHLLRAAYVQTGENLPDTRVEAIQPGSVRLAFDVLAERVVPVAPRTVGSPRAGLELARPITTQPLVVRARGARGRIVELDSVRLPPIDLAEVDGTDTIRVRIDSTSIGVSVTPQNVDVIVAMRLQEPDTATVDTVAANRRERP